MRSEIIQGIGTADDWDGLCSVQVRSRLQWRQDVSWLGHLLYFCSKPPELCVPTGQTSAEWWVQQRGTNFQQRWAFLTNTQVKLSPLINAFNWAVLTLLPSNLSTPVQGPAVSPGCRSSGDRVAPDVLPDQLSTNSSHWHSIYVDS